MATQEERIPTRSSPRAPPPPRPMEIPQPDHTMRKEKIVTRKSLTRSQIFAAVGMVIIVVFLIIILFYSTTGYESSYTETQERDETLFAFEFNMPDLMSQKVPVEGSVKATEPVEMYVLKEEDYNENLEISEIRELAIKGTEDKVTSYSFTEELEPGTYVIVSYLRFDATADIELEYNLTWFVLMPFLWIFLLIFIILIVLLIVRVALLQNKKSKLNEPEPGYDHPVGPGPTGQYQYQDDHGYYDEPEPYGYGSEYDHYDHPAPRQDYPPRRAPAQGPPPPRSPQGRPPGPAQHRPRRPPGSYRSRRPPAPTYAHAPEPEEYPKSQTQAPAKPVTIPCKCSEVIVVNDPFRPLKIECPRCGRRGLLEGKKSSGNEDIFY